MMWFALSACQAPFGADRHDLVGFRVAAIAAPPTPSGGTLIPGVALIVDGHPWSDDPVDLGWYWIAGVDPEQEVARLDSASTPVATGPAPALTVPAERPTLALIATHGRDEYRAFLSIAGPPDTFGGPTGLSVASTDLTVPDVTSDELQLAARKKLDAAPAETVAPGGFGRFEASVTGDPLVRWMATRGTFFELDRHTADWAAGDLGFDGEDIADGRSSLDPGPVTILALALGGDGETAFRSTDVYVGDEPDGLWVQGRFLPTDAPVDWQPGDAVRGTLALSDDSPTGLVLTGGTAEQHVVDWGTGALACEGPVQGPFDPNWLLAGLCSRSALDGVEVAVAPETHR